MIKGLRCPCSKKDTLSVILVNEEEDFMKVQCDECGEIWIVEFEYTSVPYKDQLRV